MNTFTGNVIDDTQKINHKLTCPASVVENSMLGKRLTAFGIDRITIRIMIESILVRIAVRKNISFNILTAWDTLVSLIMFR